MLNFRRGLRTLLNVIQILDPSLSVLFLKSLSWPSNTRVTSSRFSSPSNRPPPTLLVLAGLDKTASLSSLCSLNSQTPERSIKPTLSDQPSTRYSTTGTQKFNSSPSTQYSPGKTPPSWHIEMLCTTSLMTRNSEKS